MQKHYFKTEELIELIGMINMDIEEVKEKLFHDRINEMNHQLYLSYVNVEKAKEERDDALKKAQQAKQERDAILSALLTLEPNSKLIQILKDLIKQGKITEEDLASVE